MGESPQHRRHHLAAAAADRRRRAIALRLAASEACQLQARDLRPCHVLVVLAELAWAGWARIEWTAHPPAGSHRPVVACGVALHPDVGQPHRWTWAPADPVWVTVASHRHAMARWNSHAT